MNWFSSWWGWGGPFHNTSRTGVVYTRWVSPSCPSLSTGKYVISCTPRPSLSIFLSGFFLPYNIPWWLGLTIVLTPKWNILTVEMIYDNLLLRGSGSGQTLACSFQPQQCSDFSSYCTCSVSFLYLQHLVGDKNVFLVCPSITGTKIWLTIL